MTVAVANPPFTAALGREAIRVMVVDDAIVVRGLIARWIEAEPDLQMVASLRSGRDAIERMEHANPDVVVLDVDMPDTDGITALPRLLAKKRDLVVIMASTLTRRNAEISLRALALGAADYIPKPETTRQITTSVSFRQELIDKIRALVASRRRLAAARALPSSGPGVETALRFIAALDLPPATEEPDFVLRPFPALPPHALLIGSSTGGPQALNTVMSRLGEAMDQVPVLIVQHMPPTFTAILAEHLARASGRPAREAVHGEAVLPGRIYVAPGGRHLRVVRREGTPCIALDDGAPVNFCKPSVDPLLSSAAEVWGNRALALVLTGMGCDGSRGAADLVATGGAVIAQDEASSVVWGMPGSVAQAGLCSAVLPLDDIAPSIARLVLGARP